MSGCTANGKTILKSLINLVLGDYFLTYESTLLTNKRPPPSAPCPDIVRLYRKRFVIGSEPEAELKINSGMYKTISDKEVITARNLNDSEYYDILPTYKIAMLCNQIPVFDKDDAAVWDRTVCIPFNMTFVENPKKENERKRDPDLDEKLVLWKQDFMLLLIEYYKLYCEEGLKPTADIKSFTKQYEQSNDIYLDFINERTEKSETHVHVTVLYTIFKDWYWNSYNKIAAISRNVFVAGIKKHFDIAEQVRVGTKVTSGIKNLNVKESEDNKKNINNLYLDFDDISDEYEININDLHSDSDDSSNESNDSSNQSDDNSDESDDTNDESEDD